MGLGMATTLQKHLASVGGPPLTFFNRTISRGDPLREIGGHPASSVKDLASSSDIIFLCLSDDAALEATLDTLLDASSPLDLSGKIVVDTSTVHPSSTTKANQRLAERGATLIAAPVSGASPVAMEGKPTTSSPAAAHPPNGGWAWDPGPKIRRRRSRPWARARQLGRLLGPALA